MLGFWTPGPMELVVIGLVALVILGKKLPGMARTFGQTMIEWRKGMAEYKKEVKNGKS